MLNSKTEKGILKYLVLWEGWPLEWASWEPLTYLGNVKELIKAFHEEFKNKPGDPKLKKTTGLVNNLEDEEEPHHERNDKAGELSSSESDKSIDDKDAEDDAAEADRSVKLATNAHVNIGDFDLATINPALLARDNPAEQMEVGDVLAATKIRKHKLKSGAKSRTPTADSTAAVDKTQIKQKVETNAKTIRRPKAIAMVASPPPSNIKKRTRR